MVRDRRIQYILLAVNKYELSSLHRYMNSNQNSNWLQPPLWRCLMVRVGNLRKSVLVEACIRMQLVRQGRVTKEGELIPFEQIDLDIDLGNDSDKIFLVTPQIIVHPITEDSVRSLQSFRTLVFFSATV